jgi:hypothetical protein
VLIDCSQRVMKGNEAWGSSLEEITSVMIATEGNIRERGKDTDGVVADGVQRGEGHRNVGKSSMGGSAMGAWC